MHRERTELGEKTITNKQKNGDRLSHSTFFSGPGFQFLLKA